MKIILSRKGFDSSYGGYPSMIFENGTMQTLPIPNAKDDIKYAEILCPSKNKSLYEVMKNANTKIRCKTWIELSQESTCHLDPDIDYRSIERAKGWRGCFGQGAAAQSVLKRSKLFGRCSAKTLVQRGFIPIFLPALHHVPKLPAGNLAAKLQELIHSNINMDVIGLPLP